MEDQVLLNLATLEDIVEELRARSLEFSLYVSHFDSQPYTPSADVPSEDREKCYGDAFSAKHPAYMAGMFCRGIQACLNQWMEMSSPETAPAINELSRFVNHVYNRIGKAVKKEK
jgi:hypothetical protein